LTTDSDRPVVQEPLFDGFEEEQKASNTRSNMSAGQRRTARQRELIEAGIHPLTKRELHVSASKTGGTKQLGGVSASESASGRSQPFTCGGCANRGTITYAGSYPKCFLTFDGGSTYPLFSHSEASDCRAWWPACEHYEPGDAQVSPDAARWAGGPNT
jgi:hypothetical protein